MVRVQRAGAAWGQISSSAPNFVNDAAAAAPFQSRAPLRLAIRKLRQNPIVQDECLYA